MTKDNKSQNNEKSTVSASDNYDSQQEERNRRIKKDLIELRQKILVEAKNEIGNLVRGEDKQIVETVLDDGDLSILELTEEIVLQKLQQHKQKLDKIDEALQKIKNGTYGICEECGTQINEGRLKVLPYAVYCVECKERIEKLEAIERENPFQ
ncbi:transcriptional regulator, TraR/DksA family [Candidatus Magnetoovum chiemensis]|nr:transcriptional regulator, TraR/DksA family [Candidatus Magnetoovum chiemensis]